ncbi:hypothetical protein A7P25_24460 [Achromobacter xylosoxidans]|nr:hypothetical protein A7P25_24460 [Achromobacter xylosoxidans]
MVEQVRNIFKTFFMAACRHICMSKFIDKNNFWPPSYNRQQIKFLQFFSFIKNGFSLDYF